MLSGVQHSVIAS